MRPFRSLRSLLLAAALPLTAHPAAAQTAAMAAPRDSGYRAPATTRGAGPNGATIRCRDGSHPVPNAPDAACDRKGGVLLRYPTLRAPARPTSTAGVVPAPAPPAAPARPTELRASGTTAGMAPRGASTAAQAKVLSGRAPAGPPPRDATLLCGDGTVIRSDTASVACAPHGGVKLRFLKRTVN